MSIGNLQVIQIGLPNESTGSDSLYDAFNKTKTNFTTLFGCSSPYNTFTGDVGISTSANANTGTITITNTGVTNIIAGTGVTVNQSNGNVIISSNGGGNGSGGTVTSVGLAPVSNSRLTVTNSPIVSSGIISIDLANSGVTAGNYSYPTLTVDQYGRITTIANANSVGTVTSIGLTTSGGGIQISGGPITSAGNISIVNTGVTRLTAGQGIGLSGSNGNITVSATQTGGTVTSVGLSSTSLTVSSGAITTAGTLTVDLPSNVQVAGSLILSGSENLGSGNAASLSVTASYFSTIGSSTATLTAGTNGLIKTFMMLADGGDMIITVTNAGWKSSGTGTITFGDIGDGCTLQYINSKWFCIGQNGVTFG
jgi:filamentous hemagglutinin